MSKTLVLSKCKSILADVKRIDAILKKYRYEALITNEEEMTLCERYLERIVNRAIDVNNHLIRAFDEKPPEDYTESFFALGRMRVLTPKLTHDIAPSAGARNILVHEYDDLDTKLFYSSLRDCARLYPKYVGAIEKFLESV